MLYQTHGAVVTATVSAQMQRDGAVVPKTVMTAPTVPLGLIGYLDAFHELDTERSHGQGLARIPWSSIILYGEYYGYNADELLFFVRRMDDAYLARLREDRERGGSNGGASGTGVVVQRPPRPD